MPSTQDTAYFPPLDRCLSGAEPLIPWRLALNALLDQTVLNDSLTLETFLGSDTTISVLANALLPFSAPSDSTRKDFETRTAPIHVSQSGSSHFDLDTIKEGASWLSAQLRIDEVSALRLAIVEWQRRPADALLGKVPAGYKAEHGQNVANVEGEKVSRHMRLLETFLDERSAVKSLSAALVGIGITTTSDDPTMIYEPWLEASAKTCRRMQGESQATTGNDPLQRYIEDFKNATSQLSDHKLWPEVFQGNFSLHSSYISALLRDTTSTLRCTLIHLFSTDGLPAPQAVSSWFKLMDTFRFLGQLSNDTPNQIFWCESIQCLTAVISAAILKLPQTIAILETLSDRDVSYPNLGSKPYIEDDACVREINLILFHAATSGNPTAGPAILTWSIISMYVRDMNRLEQDELRRTEDGHELETGGYRRNSSANRRPSAMELKLEALQDMALGEFRDDPPQFLARTAVDTLNVLTVIAELSRVVSSAYANELESPVAQLCRIALFDVVQESLPTVAYDEDLLEALIALLDPQLTAKSARATSKSLVDKAMQENANFFRLVLNQALARYPYELSPLLRLLNVIEASSTASSSDWSPIVQISDNMHTVTLTLPDGFRDYTLVHEEEGANAFGLTDDLPLFVPTPALQYYSQQQKSSALIPASGPGQSVLKIPAGTEGVILRDSRPFVVKLAHSHSALEYLGLLLSTIIPNCDTIVAPPGSSLDKFTASEIVTLTTTLLKAFQSKSDIDFVLGRLGSALADELDIVAVIAEIVEIELLAQLEQTAKEGSLELLVSGVKFFDALAPFSPERVWSMLSRSSLTGVSTGTSALAEAAQSLTVQTQKTRFLDAGMKLYQTVLEDSIRGLVMRKQGPSLKTGNRFDSPVSSPGQTSERTITQVITALTRVAIETVRNLNEQFDIALEERTSITVTVVNSLNKILRTVYGLEGSASAATDFAAPLRPAAELILSALLSEDSPGETLTPFMKLLTVSLQFDDADLSSAQRPACIQETRSVVQFITTVTRSARQAGKSSVQLVSILEKSLIILAHLYALHSALRGDISQLLKEIIIDAEGSSTSRSFLAYLEPLQAKSFLDLLSDLDSPMINASTEYDLWELFSATIESKQHAFAIYLLTGTVPKERLKDKTLSLGKKSVLVYALDLLTDIKNLNPERAMAILKFVAKSQKHWVWAATLVHSHSDFLNNAVSWLDALKPCPRSANPADMLLIAREHMMAGIVSGILAISLHTSLEAGDTSLLRSLVPKLSFLTENAVRADGYNRSLHHNLAENFGKRFAGLDVAALRRTAVNPAQLGKDYVYDLATAEVLLGHDHAWTGSGKARAQGFSDEFARANVNWSLVDAQIRLLTEWKTLATTLADCAERDAAVAPLLVKTVESCLTANASTNLDEPNAAALLQTRADLAFVLTSKIVKMRVSTEQMRGLLPRTWSLVRASPVDFDVATAPEDLTYYRTLLQLLFLSIQPHVYMTSRPSSNAQSERTRQRDARPLALDPSIGGILVEIISKTVTPGFRALCGNLHESVQLALPSDFALLIALTRASMSVRGIQSIYVQIADAIALSSNIRSALSLYSWSDRLADLSEQDPIYGEMAVSFLTTLSSVPQVAEQMALEGALTQLSSANLSSYLRKPGGKGAFDEPARMFTIWANGFLPLCLNLLEAVGPPIAAEVSSFLNSFPQQLARASTALQNAQPTPRNPRAGAVTLSTMTEARNLILTAQIMTSCVALGAAEGIAVSDIGELQYDTQGVKDDVEALTKSTRSLRDRIVPATERDVAMLNEKTAASTDDALHSAVVREINQITALFEK